MADDRQQISNLIDTWGRASAAGDLDKILSLMDSDAVFLVAGRPPMRGREEFAAQFKQVIEEFRIGVTSDIQEIEISGYLAYCWNHLAVTVTPLAGGAAMRRSGPVLTIFRKKADGSWVLSRDANLLAEESSGK
jgi:uncharacterized protein (TIGR02246 family)